jgi:hypothetical protein
MCGASRHVASQKSGSDLVVLDASRAEASADSCYI